MPFSSLVATGHDRRWVGLVTTLVLVVLPIAAQTSSNRPAPLVMVSTLAGRSRFGASDGRGSEVGFANPFGLAADAAGNVFVSDTVNHTIRKISRDGVVTTLAGRAGEAGSSEGPGPQARFHGPQGIAVNAAGTVFVADSGNNTIRAILPGGEVRTIAGSGGAAGHADGPGTAARFNNPTGIAVDATGRILVTDSFNGTVRAISPSGEVSTLAGTAGEFGGDDGTGPAARFLQPTAVAVDAAGVAYVVDSAAQTIRAIDPAGRVTTVAGKHGEGGDADGEGGSARFNSPRGIAVDRAGNLVVGDLLNGTIRLIQPAGVTSTIAGHAGEETETDGPLDVARFDQPAAVTVSPDGVIYVSDLGGSTIRTIAAGEVRTLAGEASRGDRDGPVDTARFNSPAGVAVDGAGRIYVADAGNHLIRRLSPGGVVDTLAGLPGVAGLVDGRGSEARFRSPNGIAVDEQGNLYVADEGNRAVRRVEPDGTTVTLANAAAGLVDPTAVALDASGNLYVSDPVKHTIDRISATGEVTTFAGSAFQRGTEDGVGGAARFDDPYGLAIDRAGFIYVADRNGTIRRISPAAEVVTVAGQAAMHEIRDGAGRDARFLLPGALTVDALGNVYVADGGTTLRQITPAGRVITLAGRAGLPGGVNGAGDDARFALPGGIAVDHAAHLFIADSANNSIREAVSATRLVNLSARGRVGTGDQTPVMGFVVAEGGAKPLLVRAVGPGLEALGVSGATRDPRLQLFDGTREPIAENDNWNGTELLTHIADAVGAFPLDPGSPDAALFATVPPGLFTVHTTAAGDAGGVALMELYDADTAGPGRLINLSARLYAGAADETLIVGFVLSGAMPKQVLVRVAGKSLAPLGVGVSGLLVDPMLTLFAGPTAIAANDDWGATEDLKAAFRAVGAFDFGADASKDAALLVTLQPGIYTAHATPATPGPGVALVEIYEVP